MKAASSSGWLMLAGLLLLSLLPLLGGVIRLAELIGGAMIVFICMELVAIFTSNALPPLQRNTTRH